MRRLIVGHTPNTVRNCPRAASEVVDNTIGTVNVFKKQRTNNRASQLLVADGEAPQLLRTDLQISQLSTSLASQDILKIRVARAQRKIQDKKKPNTTTQARDNAIQGTILLLYGDEFRAKNEQVACIRRLIYDRIDIILIA